MTVVAIDALLAVVALVVLGLALLALRRRVITRRGGTFECSLRLSEAPHGKGWVMGIGRYAGDALEWYRVFSYSMRPRRALRRSGLKILDRREPAGVEAFALLSGATVIRCQDADGRVELAMSAPALTGFLSWVESAPPGVHRS